MKYCQIGSDAALALLQGITEGANISQCKALLFIDLWTKVGDFLSAFSQIRADLNTSSFYVGFCENQMELEWAEATVTDELQKKFFDGELALPGGTKIVKEMPDDLKDPLPPLPTLNKLVISGDEHQLFVPVSIVKDWQFHKTMGPEFVKWLDKFTAEYGGVLEASPGSLNKRKGAEEPKPMTPRKKQKTADESQVMENCDIKQALLTEVQVGPEKESSWLQVRSNHIVLLVNKSTTKENRHEMYDLMGGFGKGSFKLLKGQEEPQIIALL